MRAVIDPNVLVSAVISPTGSPRLLVIAWAEGRFELIMSPVLVKELREVLARPKFRQWVSAETAADYVDGLEDSAIVMDDPPPQTGVSPGPILSVGCVRCSGRRSRYGTFPGKSVTHIQPRCFHGRDVRRVRKEMDT